MKRFIALLTVLTLTLGLCACKSTAARWQEQYDLGMRYLGEGEYEEAIIAFNAAIEIDPMQADAYLNLANAYIGMNDFDAAREILEQGYELTQNEELKAKLDELEKIIAGSRIFTDAVPKPKEFTVGGRPFWELTLEEVQARYANVNPGGETDSRLYLSNSTTRGFSQFMAADHYSEAWSTIIAQQTIGDAGINLLSFYVHEKQEGADIPLELRDVHMWESCAEVLPKLGFQQKWIDEFLSLGAGEDIKFHYDGQNWIADSSEDVADFVGGDDAARRRIGFYWLDFSCETIAGANYLYFGLDFNGEDELTEVHLWAH